MNDLIAVSFWINTEKIDFNALNSSNSDFLLAVSFSP